MNNLINYAKELRKNKDWVAYLEVSQKIVNLYPDQHTGHLYRAIGLIEIEKPNEALIEIKNAINIAPHNPYNNFYCAEIHIKLKNYCAATTYLKKYIYYKPKEPKGYLKTAELLFNQRKYLEAINLLYQGIVFTNSLMLITRLFNYLLKYNELKQAKSVLENLIKERDKQIYFKNKIKYVQVAQSKQQFSSYIHNYFKESTDEATLIYLATMLMNPMMKNQDIYKGAKVIEKIISKKSNSFLLEILAKAYIHLNFKVRASEIIDQLLLISDYKIKDKKLIAWNAYYHNDLNLEKSIWNKLLLDKFHITLDAQVKLPTLIKGNVDIKANDIILFCCMYNEESRLPSFLTYYRKLGISKFFIINNNSTDGTNNFLMKQEDVVMFFSDQSYSEAGQGIYWINSLIDKYIDSQWFLVVDADEFLVYDNCENINLQTYTQTLEKDGYEALSGFMLDVFYKNYNPEVTSKSNNLFDQQLYFINDYEFKGKTECPYFWVNGGIFETLECGRWQLTKTPLVKGGCDIKFLSSTDSITPAKIYPINSVLLHFKLNDDIIYKAKAETHRKEYSSGGRYYTKMVNAIKNLHGKELTQFPFSIRFKNSKQLKKLKIIRDITQLHKEDN